MKPHLWVRNGQWICSAATISGVNVVWWPMGMGASAVLAYAAYAGGLEGLK